MPRGRKGDITYRIVVSEKRSKLVGKMVDDLGYYNDLSKKKLVSIDKKKVEYWQSKGAQISPAVKAIIEES
jgi:small subunit ribosomal protein S16